MHRYGYQHIIYTTDNHVSFQYFFDLKRLSKIYKSVHDVDLFVLGMAEKPLKGALVGPTFACILGQQYQKVCVVSIYSV
jgi:hypothetical protein